MREPLITAEEAARLIGVTERTVRTWIATGILPAYRLGPRVVRLKMADVERALTPVQAAA